MATPTKKKVGFFTDNNGNKSSTRLITFIGALCIFGIWTFVSIYNREMTAIGYEHAALLGVLIAGKSGQTFLEKK